MHLYRISRRYLLPAILITFTFFILHPKANIAINSVYYLLYPRRSIQCYHTKNSATLPDITDDIDEPPKDASIFFHETSCNSYYNGKIVITARQACAVESAASSNPDMAVYLLFASPGVLKLEDDQESDRFIKALLQNYPNIKLRHIDFEKYTKSSPVEELYRDKRVDYSGYAQSHASDVLRYLTLWKYGGIYLDLDVVVMKSLREITPNFAGSESDENVAAGALSFSSSGIGHELAQQCLEDLKANFTGSDWGANGPGVITRLLKRICGVNLAKDMVGRECQGGFKVFAPDAFYPIAWRDWNMYFEEYFLESVEKMSRDSYTIHVWNKHSVNKKIHIGGTSHTAYEMIARKFCPKVFHECLQYF